MDDVFTGVSEVLRPRWQVTVAGKVIRGCYSCEVHNTNARQAARASMRIAMSDDPELTPAWWAKLDRPDCEIKAAFLPEGAEEGTETWTTLWMGPGDKLHLDTLRGQVEIEGRDYLGKLLETKTRETFANKTSSEVVQIIAARHGYTADVTPTTILVGQYYKIEHDRTTLDSTSKTSNEGEILFRLAKEEGYDVYMTGKTIHFHPAAKVDTSNPHILTLTPRSQDSAYPISPVTDIVYERDWGVAKDIKVIIKSWNSHNKHASETVYPEHAKKDAAVYTFVRPNLSPAEALKQAQSMHEDISKHERRAQITMPGELKLMAQGPQAVVKLVGTETSADGFEMTFFVDEVTREFSFDGSFVQHVRLKNHSATTEPT